MVLLLFISQGLNSTVCGSHTILLAPYQIKLQDRKKGFPTINSIFSPLILVAFQILVVDNQFNKIKFASKMTMPKLVP